MKIDRNKLRVWRPEEDLKIDRLCVPIDKCISVKLGIIDDTTLSTLEQRGFDYAPVYDSVSKRLWGLVSTAHLRRLKNSGQSLVQEDSGIELGSIEFRIRSSASIFLVLERLAQNSAVIVISESDATEYGHAEWINGLFTISDLNRHAIRGLLYNLLIQLETGLAEVIEKLVPDPWHWIDILSYEHQARTVGYWEISKRRGVDIDPIAGTTLAQLLSIITKSRGPREALGFKSGGEFSDSTGRFADFRNRIMHPVRPLILGLEDVSDLYETVLRIEELRDRAYAVLAKG